MRGQLLITAAITLSCSRGAVAAQDVDGAKLPETTDVAYSFACNDIRSQVSYEEQRRSPDSVSQLNGALRVTLTELAVSGRKLGQADIAIARDLVGRFAWIEKVSSTCDAGNISIQFRGMPRNAWASFLGKKMKNRPDLVSSTIRILASGKIVVANGLR